jgi:hypothetical protein
VDDAHSVAVVVFVYGGAPEQLEQVLPLWKRLLTILKKKLKHKLNKHRNNYIYL